MAHHKILYTGLNQLKYLTRSFSLAKANSGIFSKYSQIYETCIKYPQLASAQKNTLKTEELLSSKQALTDLCWSNLQLNQEKLREIGYNLDPLSTVDFRYPPLLQDEVYVLNRMQSLSRDFYSYHQDEVEGANSLSIALQKGIIRYHETERRIQWFLFTSIALGLLLGCLLAFYWDKLYEYLTSREIYSSDDLKALIKNIVDMIRTNNIILYKQLEDLRLLSMFQEDAFVCPTIGEILPQSFENNELFYAQLTDIISSIDEKDALTGEDMIIVEKGLLKRRKFNELPLLDVDANLVDTNRGEKGLFLTICTYISVAILFPIALVVMA